MNNLLYHITNTDQSLILRRTGLEEYRLKQIQDDVAKVSYPELVLFSKVLGLPVSALLSEHNAVGEIATLFRKQQGSAKNPVLVDKISFLIREILEFLPSKSVDLSRIGTGVNNYENAEEIAKNFRSLFLEGNHFEAFTSLPELLAKLGVIIQVVELGEKVDGSCARVNDINFIFLSPRFPGRMLMSLAHELGHLINHTGKDSFLVLHTQNSSDKRKFQLQEDFATHFASSLLLPSKGIAQLITSIRQHFEIDSSKAIGDIEIMYIARYYGLSFEATAQRLEILGLIPEGGAYSLTVRIKQDYGSPEKRAKELNLIEREEINFKILPDFLLDKILNGLNNGEYSIGQICQVFNLTISELNSLNNN